MKYIHVYIISLTFLFSNIMEIDSSLIRDSKKSFKWSLIPIVSQGQMYNKKYLKSIFFTGFQSYALSRMFYYNSLISALEIYYYPDYRWPISTSFDNDVNIIKRNVSGWWFLGIYALSIIDSYVDAELSSFPNRLK
mgnify:CR=1 FL=1